MMKQFVRIFPVGHFVICVMFVIGAVALLGFAVVDLANALSPWSPSSATSRLDQLLNAIAHLTSADAAF